MATPKSWINAARLRTLPLALSGIVMGSALAAFYGAFDLTVFILAVVTATLIQVFSNFANDYGDFQKGTDNHQRLGPTRTMQGGEITPSEMKKGMIVVGGLSFILGIALVYTGTWTFCKIAFFGFIGLGILALLAAYFYTAGKKSYGYIGLGDLSVFLFFGLLPVIGVFFLHSNFFENAIILPAISMGFFSAGVLNLNNMRDIQNDQQSGKITMAVKMGSRNSRIYHIAIIAWGWIAAIVFTLHQQESAWQWLFLLTLPLFLMDLIKIYNTKEDRLLDPFLKRLALGTLAFTLLFSLGLILSF
ncbi:1,4-dihydroxy-2-naphthoate polyprenyltransferase [Mangrovibacterium diazotrophicum]|uniref:1,4-dihydroxy-2-naphthoate octaprenyltransferase n=1 Tax=Mangrovibacterium diazotrophicum TaxID=1261403 RepID=A0A419W8X0_9BACT|nr:1,4-dihydroxy-2-naphthoate polyprenyltransferase [Mangrovibacterium diazotrophicum]RKD91905.1 1,4-dihydroxy-2-naphthoate prenyltransferase [Mangrovibacterium diazotrophicum]